MEKEKAMQAALIDYNMWIHKGMLVPSRLVVCWWWFHS